DRNPLHSDPAFAERAGFPAPILHGLCSYGIVLREVVEGLLDSDSARVAGFVGRFAGVVFPGETIRTRAWEEGARIVISATIASTMSPVITATQLQSIPRATTMPDPMANPNAAIARTTAT